MTGLGGAFCTMCTASWADGHDIVLIENQGFPIDRSMEDIHALFTALAEMDHDGDMMVVKSAGDYEWRTGLTSKPLTNMDLVTCLPPLHAKLRVFGMCLTLAYSYRSGVKKMGRGIGRNTTPADKEAIAAAKQIIQALARKLFGTKLDQPDAYGHGGNSDTGNQ